MVQNHAGDEAYDEKFYLAQKDGSYRSASIILPVLMKYVRPHKVIDIGCGVGTWLAVWKNLGAEVHGIDGDYVDRKQLLITGENFHPANLEERLSVNAKFDLVETMEVAEHLTPARADSFVEDLTKLGDVILFSAAILGQGGTNHVNEQMQSYWAEKFIRLGYVGVDCIRPQIWNDQRIEICYRQNTLVYVKSTELYRYPELQKYYLDHLNITIYDLVHPQLFVGRTNQFISLLSAQNGGGGGRTPLIRFNFKNFNPLAEKPAGFLVGKIYSVTFS